MHKTIRICRLCLKSKQPSETSMDDETFRARLNAVSNFTFDDNRQLPADVCSGCSQRIDQFYTFMESVRCNQERLQLSQPPIQVKIEISQESPYESFSSTVKTEVESPEHETEIMEVDVEMHANPPVAEKTEEENEPEEPVENEDEDVEEPASPLLVEGDGPDDEITDEDRLIKKFFSLKCDKCSESFETLKNLRSHAKKLHNSQAVLNCCDKNFASKHKILYHINTHLKPCKCEECGKGFPDKHTLKVHIGAKHPSPDDNQFKCDKCTRSFKTKQILQTHLRLHNRVECPICKRSLSNMYILKTHMSLVHSDERKFICDVCGKDFKSLESLNKHSVLHSELKREDGVRCEICHKWISRKNQLRRHMVDVHQPKEVTCDICHKVYTNEKSLTTHKGRVHVDDKFECEICGKRFKRHVNLREHRASHTGEKLYSCEFCGMEMNSNGNLYSHKKNKHPEQWMEAKQRAEKFLD